MSICCEFFCYLFRIIDEFERCAPLKDIGHHLVCQDTLKKVIAELTLEVARAKSYHLCARIQLVWLWTKASVLARLH